MTERRYLPIPEFPPMGAVEGVRFATASSGLKYVGRNDLLLAAFDEGVSAAGIFTRSDTASAPVRWSREAVGRGGGRVLVVNAGNANAFTGKAGIATVQATAEAAASLFDVAPEDVLLASTGVVGVPIPVEVIPAALPAMKVALAPNAWRAAAEAIMTTDSHAKGASRQARIGDVTVSVNGFVKGSQMIAPDMATTLGFVFTDAAIPHPLLQEMLAATAARSFNSISIDGDMSTSDSLFAFATGKARHPIPTDANRDALLRGFRQALDEVCRDLALLVVQDAEGARRLLKISVSGAATARSAHNIGRTVADSPLVKAGFKEDRPVWGRIAMAVGKAGERADIDRLRISLGGIVVTDEGGPLAGFDADAVARHVAGSRVEIGIDLGLGRGAATIWTTDGGHGFA